MKSTLISILVFFSVGLLNAQTIHDFTFADSDGNTHTLYADYLNQGKHVLIKFFFSTCPPCNATAPAVQSLYEQYGEGQGDIEFIALSNKTWDTNSNAGGFKSQHGLTFPVAGNDGGAYDAALPFLQGTYGTFFGTPSYALVLPDGTVQHPLPGGLSAAETAIENALNSGGQPSTNYGVQFQNFKNGGPISVNGLSVILKPRNSSAPVVDLIALTNGSLSFTYPSPDIPEMNDPIIIVSSDAGANSSEISPIDIVTIRRHILQLANMDLPFQTMAGDLNGDGRITGQDVVALNKVFLQITDEFPNGTPSYLFMPSQMDVNVDPGNTVNISFSVLKMGDTSIN